MRKHKKLYDDFLNGVLADHKFLQENGLERPGSFPTSRSQFKGHRKTKQRRRVR